MMHLSFAATNPCHLFDLAKTLAKSGTQVNYYSGYPEWKLNGLPCRNLKIYTSSFRTLITYGIIRTPENWRPNNSWFFKWQDQGFDKAIAKKPFTGNIIHGLPGQCLEIFKKAKALKMKCVLNHASGPVRQQLEMMRSEYERVGIPLNLNYGSPDYMKREQEEYDLADYHCCASSIVKQQLIAHGIEEPKIMICHYGADSHIFSKRKQTPTEKYRILFAGGLTLRKGIFYLLKALERSDKEDWELNLFGPQSSETTNDFKMYKGAPKIKMHGAVSQIELSKQMKRSSVLVLPSIEEAFGLVVVQALQSGIPCIVSDRVGAKDLIKHRVNGSIVPFGDVDMLKEELQWWHDNPKTIQESYDWSGPAEVFLAEHKRVFEKG